MFQEYSAIKWFIFCRNSRSCVLAYLLQVRTHSFTSSLWIMLNNRFEDVFMVNLSTLWATIYCKDLFALLTEEHDNGIDKRENKGVLRCLRQSLVEIVVRPNIQIGVLEVGIHDCHRFTHGG